MGIFNDRLKEAMAIRNVTQQKLADLSGISKVRVHNYATKGQEANIDALLKFSKVLDVPVSWLVGEDVPLAEHCGSPQILLIDRKNLEVFKAVELILKLDQFDLGAIVSRIEMLLESEKYRKP